MYIQRKQTKPFVVLVKPLSVLPLKITPKYVLRIYIYYFCKDLSRNYFSKLRKFVSFKMLL